MQLNSEVRVPSLVPSGVCIPSPVRVLRIGQCFKKKREVTSSVGAITPTRSIPQVTVLRLASNKNVFIKYPYDNAADQDNASTINCMEDMSGGGNNYPTRSPKCAPTNTSVSTAHVLTRPLVPLVPAISDAEYLCALSPVQKIWALLDHAPRVRHFDLCCETVPFFHQPDLWSCGYRNIQMILTALRIMQINDSESVLEVAQTQEIADGLSGETIEGPQVVATPSHGVPVCMWKRTRGLNEADDDTTTFSFDVVRRWAGSGAIEYLSTSKSARDDHQFHSVGAAGAPSVCRLQVLLEQAWSKGYDPEGSALFGPQGVQGTERRIGSLHTAVVSS